MLDYLDLRMMPDGICPPVVIENQGLPVSMCLMQRSEAKTKLALSANGLHCVVTGLGWDWDARIAAHLSRGSHAEKRGKAESVAEFRRVNWSFLAFFTMSALALTM